MEHVPWGQSPSPRKINPNDGTSYPEGQTWGKAFNVMNSSESFMWIFQQLEMNVNVKCIVSYRKLQ